MFAVFGVTHDKARDLALKKTKRTVGKGKKQRELSEDEYQKTVQSKTEINMEKMKPVILSPEYSSPEFANEFMSMARGVGMQRLEVRINAPVERRSKKNGVRIGRTWVKYVPGKKYSIS